ncbi:ring-cleaving dioxygenase [Bacillus sp. GM2]|uniref:ring-cleaving dioxygenase n=1 Tax=Bacillus TaxID=1386 RepID=UPI000951B024|nr:ring-cleaving dioxygenase [Bacillus paralicheniformis]MSO00843.1 ring-cleaving dioxygenase [Bacillus paralicheniformis]MSO04851.1 ring-cleaving dioxygenase [Bacillus paralicheniformis]MSO08844.1 ring-cleaving dioxygenase [Bacillus paralicheniformis]MSO12838.1 ring-cleaving dioxygenase [Bacillus paralicheniformis]NJE39335.1 ring-cleaving dioxygenase [Bacillus paralicheniformis]
MKKKTSGIHHITAIVGHPQENVDFYAGVLGLRLVKKTVNFDDPGTYHLYFGNEGGKPGTIITFFPWAGARRGVIGDGQVGVTSYVVPKGAMAFWENRLAKFNVPYTKMNRFGEEYLEFDDPHGLHLEIVEREQGEKNRWKVGEITPDNAIKGFGGATLLSKQPEKTAELLEKVMGLEKVGAEGDFVRFRSAGDIGNMIDLKLTTIGSGQMGTGTVHHIAWRAIDDNDQLEWQKYVAENGYRVTPVQDRNYFNAIYFREHGEILFEIATDPPGFAHDESYETMGEQLMLPAQYEHYREQLERRLIPVTVKALD